MRMARRDNSGRIVSMSTASHPPAPRRRARGLYKRSRLTGQNPGGQSLTVTQSWTTACPSAGAYMRVALEV